MEDIALPLMIRTRIEKESNTVLYIPEVVGHWNPYVEREINWHMYNESNRLAKQQFYEQDASQMEEMIGTYEIKTNERHVLSVTFTNYAYVAGYAHGLTLMSSLTFDIRSGERYSLPMLFKPGTNIERLLTPIVQSQVRERDVPVFDEQVIVDEHQPFYIADLVLVLYYELYAITPYYYGFPRFPIPIYEIESFIDESGPLGQM